MALWICQSLSCAYQEVAHRAHYCAWCGQDLMALCIDCQEPLDVRSGKCLSCFPPLGSDSHINQMMSVEQSTHGCSSAPVTLVSRLGALN